MRQLRLTLFVLLSLALLATDARAQQIMIGGDSSIQLPGMGPRQVKTGTGRISGRIVSADTGAPVRRAQVRISGSEIATKTAMTDADGRYEFRDLPAGRFNLTAQKSGFMTVQYGQTRPFESGKAIELTSAQVLDKAEIVMPRGSVISGRIADEFGDPIADATVTAMRSTWSGGRRRLQSAGRPAQTNDLGQYRIFGLPPGEYYVSATFRGGDMQMIEMGIVSATMSGGPSGSTPNSGYAPTYFPGTTNGGDAQRLSLAVGQEAQGTDFALMPVRLAKVTGTVIGSDGKPVEGTMVSATPRTSGADVVIGGGSTARTDKNGNFTINNVPPGDYTLQTRGGITVMSDGGGGNTMVFTMSRTIGPEGRAAEGEPEFGSMPLGVSGDDISNVVIITSKGATANGRLTFEGGMKPEGGGATRILASPIDADGPAISGSMPATVAADGTFELKGLAGLRMIRPLALPQGWMLKTVRVNGQDVTDTGIDFKTDPVGGIEIVVTNKLTDVSGSVSDSSGNPVKDYTVVVFSDDPQKWTAPQNRYVTGARPDTDGRFKVKNLPAGGYYAVAVEYIAQGEWGDPEVLDRLKARATRVSLDEGEKKSVDLKIER